MSDAATVTIAGRGLACPHCGHDRFHRTTGAIDRFAWGGLVHLEGVMGHEVTIYACGRCGCTQLFMGVPEERQETPAAPEPVPEEACLSCGAIIPADAKACPKCGWTWEAAKEG